jgi:hypothetical protein
MLLLWMALQLLALGLSAARVPLFARFPNPIERQAILQMLVMQIAASALLFPALLRSWRSLVLAAAGAWPMLALANLLGGEPPFCAANATLYLTVWLTTLTLWNRTLTNDHQRAIAVAIASLWSIGGPLFLYLHIEAAGASGLWPPESKSLFWAVAAGPMWAQVDRLWGGRWVQWSDFPLFALLTGGFLAFFAGYYRSQKIVNKLSTNLQTSGYLPRPLKNISFSLII